METFNTKITSLLFILFVNALVFSQKNKEELFFNSIVKRKADKHNEEFFFVKASSFFINKKWDSTLIYTSKQLDETSIQTDIGDFLHYFRGFTFKKKKLFKEAQKEFELISLDFDYFDLVKMHMGQLSLEMKKYEDAIYFLKPLLILDNEKYKYINRNVILSNLAISNLHLGHFNKAEEYLLKSKELNEKIKDTINIIKSYVNLANLYYNQYKDNLAIPYFEKAYLLSKNVEDFQIKHYVADNMAIVEENRKNYKKALAYRKEYEQWKDSLNNQNKIYEVAQLEKQFAVKQKQQEVDLLQVENKAKEVERNGLLYSALTLLILLGVTFYFYKEKNKTHKIIVAQKETLDALNATKDKLFSIVSHDLRSSVNALKTSNAKLLSNLEANNLDALDTLLQRNSGIVNGAYNLLDNLLHWALLQTKQSYFYIEPLRLFFITEQVSHNYKPLLEDQGLTFENSVLKTAKVLADQESLKIILRNLLDNAIKFSKPNGQIKICTTVNGDFCNLIVEDTGLGMSADTVATLLRDTPNLAKKENEDIIGTGLGVQLCKSYIQKNNGSFSIESTLGKGTKMIVALPKTT